jgi:hypothetical protein
LLIKTLFQTGVRVDAFVHELVASFRYRRTLAG